ncbi:MAG TPA: hypothetical protein PLV68_16215, partial [Ilumatobacteraceae bacterium]|nr:hypothetical protein [Ilumatobacteraceae bacterium]
EGLARAETLKDFPAEVLVDDFDLPMPLEAMPGEFQLQRKQAFARYDELLAKFAVECKAEGDHVRELGGLYVL